MVPRTKGKKAPGIVTELINSEKDFQFPVKQPTEILLDKYLTGILFYKCKIILLVISATNII